ncbi:hypothetical protein SAMN02910301_0361 [Lachnospiraceae bacterium XBD2001]|nr:hypothetical protein SAMN02910301_0361 [Lachnospiraceae bacterium XBD2001]
MNQKNYFRSNLINIFFFVLTICISGLFLYISRFSLLKTDDFSQIQFGFGYYFTEGDAFHAAKAFTTMVYETMQGTFFSNFCSSFLLIKTATNYARFRLIIGLFTLLFFASFMLLLKTLSKHFHFDAIWGIFIFCGIWIAVDYIGPGEALFYMVGACVYGLPLALGFLCISLYSLLMRCEQKSIMALLIIGASITGFLSCGGVLMSAAMVNIFLVYFFIYRWFTTRKIPIRGIVPFIFTLCSALINALCPGNFMRFDHDVSAKLNYVDSLLRTVMVTNQQLRFLFTQTYLLVALVLIALAVFISKGTPDQSHFRINPIIVIIAGYMVSYIVLFPVVLGYNLVLDMYIEQRVRFAFASISSIAIVTAWTYLMFWIKSRYKMKEFNRMICISTSIVLLLICGIANHKYINVTRSDDSDPTLTAIYNELSTGKLEQYYLSYRLALQIADDTPLDQTAIVSYEIPESSLFTYSAISSDPAHWVNLSVAAVYQLPGFAYCPDHPFSEQDLIDAGYTKEQLLP